MKNEDQEPDYETTRLATRRLVAMNITELRLARRLSVAELARRAEVPERDLEEVEAASGEMLIDTLSSIAQALDVDVVVFFRPRTNDVH